MKEFIAKNVWRVTGYHDGGYQIFQVGYFVNKRDAEVAARNQGEFGSNGSISLMDLKIQVFESLEEYEVTTFETEKEAALAKLTEKERKLLGLD